MRFYLPKFYNLWTWWTSWIRLFENHSCSFPKHMFGQGLKNTSRTK